MVIWLFRNVFIYEQFSSTDDTVCLILISLLSKLANILYFILMPWSEHSLFSVNEIVHEYYFIKENKWLWYCYELTNQGLTIDGLVFNVTPCTLDTQYQNSSIPIRLIEVNLLEKETGKFKWKTTYFFLLYMKDAINIFQMEDNLIFIFIERQF